MSPGKRPVKGRSSGDGSRTVRSVATSFPKRKMYIGCGEASVFLVETWISTPISRAGPCAVQGCQTPCAALFCQLPAYDPCSRSSLPYHSLSIVLRLSSSFHPQSWRVPWRGNQYRYELLSEISTRRRLRFCRFYGCSGRLSVDPELQTVYQISDGASQRTYRGRLCSALVGHNQVRHLRAPLHK